MNNFLEKGDFNLQIPWKPIIVKSDHCGVFINEIFENKFTLEWECAKKFFMPEKRRQIDI